MRGRLDREKPGEQRYKDHADYGYTSAGHELLHALALSAWIIIAISFQEVNCSPDTQASAQGNNEGLKNGNSRVEKFHK